MDIREDKNAIKRFLAIFSGSCSSLTLLQGQIGLLRDAANNRVRGHASVCVYAPLPLNRIKLFTKAPIIRYSRPTYYIMLAGLCCPLGTLCTDGQLIPVFLWHLGFLVHYVRKRNPPKIIEFRPANSHPSISLDYYGAR